MENMMLTRQDEVKGPSQREEHKFYKIFSFLATIYVSEG